MHWERGENAIPKHVKALFAVHTRMVEVLAQTMTTGVKVDAIAKKLAIPRFTVAEAERRANALMETKAKKKRKV